MSQAGITNLTGGSSPTVPTSFTTDSGTAIPAANIIDFTGAGGITTSGLGNVVTITGSSSVPTGALGTVLQGQGVGNPPAYSTATYPSTATGTGTLLRADGTNWTVTTSTYPATNAVSTLLYASAANVMNALTTANNGALVTSNTGVPSILGGPGTTGNILQSNAAAAPSFSTATYPSTAGTSGKVLISDGTNIVSSTPTFPNASATSGKFIRSDGTNWIASTPTLPTSAGTTGKVLQSDGTNYVESTPTYPSTSGSSGKILISDGTNNIYSTPTYPNAASTSLKHIKSDGTNFVTTTVTYPDAAVTAGKVMVSDGSNYIASTPTFPNASATSGKIIKSDGTNWIASTETYAAPGTSGNVMTSDGTNWTSTSPGGYVLNMNQIGSFGPADATTYYVGVLTTGWETVATTATTQLVVPRTGTVTQVYGRVTCTAGSSQSVTLILRLNNTSDTTITSSSNWSSSPIAFNVTGLTVAVTAGDFLQLKINTPTWNPTNPTAVFVTWSVYIA